MTYHKIKLSQNTWRERRRKRLLTFFVLSDYFLNLRCLLASSPFGSPGSYQLCLIIEKIPQLRPLTWLFFFCDKIIIIIITIIIKKILSIKSFAALPIPAKQLVALAPKENHLVKMEPNECFHCVAVQRKKVISFRWTATQFPLSGE